MSRLLSGLLLFALVVSARAADPPSGLRDLGALGLARGFVLDAERGGYLPGARVDLVLPADAQTIGGAAAITSAAGWYQVNAPLGTRKKSLNLDVFRSGQWWQMLLGHRKTETHVQASQLVLRVSAEGYQTFCGPVRVAAASAKPFLAHLCPVRLAPNGAAYRSFSDYVSQLGRLLSAEVTPELPAANEVLVCRLTAAELPQMTGETAQAAIVSPSLADPARLPRVGTGEPVTCEAKLRFATPGLVRLEFQTTTTAGSLAVPLRTRRFVAVAVPAPQREATAAAVQRLNQLAASRPAEDREVRTLEIALRRTLADPKQLAADDEAWTKLTEAVGRRDFVAANGLRRAADRSADSAAEKALTSAVGLAAEVVAKPGRARSRTAYLRAAEQFREALALNEPETHPTVAAPAVAAALQQPNFAPLPTLTDAGERLEAARLAIREGRAEAATTELNALRSDQKLAPVASACLANYEYQQGHLDAARQLYNQVMQPANYKAITDFDAYLNTIRLALRDGDIPRAESLFDVAILYSQVRSQAIDKNGWSLFGLYSVRWGPSYTGSVGFTSPEAAALQVLRTYHPFLAKPEGDWLSATLAAMALVDLGLGETAQPLLAKALAARPDDEHVQFAIAWALRAMGQRDAAQQAARRTLVLNRRHPRALLMTTESPPAAAPPALPPLLPW